MRKITLLIIFSWRSLAGLTQDGITRTSVNVDTIKVQIKLTKAVGAADCGYFAWTVAQKFELLQNGISFFPKKYIIVLQQCPELLGRTFFAKGKVYEAVLTSTTEEKNAINSYRNEKLPTYWCNQIKPIFSPAKAPSETNTAED